MFMVISPILKRQLQIIQYLYKNKEEQNIKKLVELTKVTESTIRSDINQINVNFPPLYIEEYSKGQVKLISPSNVGIQYVYRRVMHLSIEIELFEYLLYRPNQSKSFYTEKFFISESLLRRIINKWNKFFKKKNLDISITIAPTVSVNGNEISIRKLYYNCLIEKYMGDFQSDFFKHNISTWELITHLQNIFSIKYSYSCHLKLSYWFFVCIQRMKNGYTIKQEYIKNNKNASELFYNEISNNTLLKEQFFHDHQIQLTLDTLLDIIGVYDLDLLIADHLIKKVPNYAEKGLSIVVVKQFLLSLYESIHYKNASFEQTLILTYIFLTFQDSTPFFFYNHFEEFREYVQKENPFFLEMFELNLNNSDLPSYLKENDKLKDEFLYYVIINAGILLDAIPQVAQQKKILILTTFHKYCAYNIKKKLENKFIGSVSVSIYDSKLPRLDLNYIKNFDIILTNYDHLPNELSNQIIYLDIGRLAKVFEKIKIKLNEDQVQWSI